jgi:hypothetical protein
VRWCTLRRHEILRPCHHHAGAAVPMMTAPGPSFRSRPRHGPDRRPSRSPRSPSPSARARPGSRPRPRSPRGARAPRRAVAPARRDPRGPHPGDPREGGQAVAHAASPRIGIIRYARPLRSRLKPRVLDARTTRFHSRASADSAMSPGARLRLLPSRLGRFPVAGHLLGAPQLLGCQPARDRVTRFDEVLADFS